MLYGLQKGKHNNVYFRNGQVWMLTFVLDILGAIRSKENYNIHHDKIYGGTIL